MPSYQYRKSHCGDKTIFRPSYLHSGISYTGKMTSLYWIRALSSWHDIFQQKLCRPALIPWAISANHCGCLTRDISINTLQWCKTSITESQITGNSIVFFKQFVQANIKESIQAPLVDIGPVMRKKFRYHDVNAGLTLLWPNMVIPQLLLNRPSQLVDTIC